MLDSSRVVRHGKPSNTYLATLRKATTRDFDILVKSCMTAILWNEVDVIISFAYTFRFPDTFPRGICISKEADGSNVHKVKAKKLLTWLNENGYTYITVEMLGVQKRAFTEMEKEFEI